MVYVQSKPFEVSLVAEHYTHLLSENHTSQTVKMSNDGGSPLVRVANTICLCRDGRDINQRELKMPKLIASMRAVARNDDGARGTAGIP